MLLISWDCFLVDIVEAFAPPFIDMIDQEYLSSEGF
jgi:hypothetical protein